MNNRQENVLKYFRQNRDFMETAIQDNIERYRKGDAQITVTDKDGHGIPNAKIKIKQKTHEFKYGANIFMLDEFESHEKNEIYRENFKEIANIATLPFYWDAVEPEQNKLRFDKDSPKIYRRPAIDLCMEYCAENNIEPKCHCLNYDNFRPKWLDSTDTDTYKRMLEKRFREISERYADRIPSFEVTNETFHNKIFKNQPKTDCSKFYLEDDFVEWSFELANKYFPNNHLIINDFLVFENAFFGTRSAYYAQIERLLSKGAHLDSIGMQMHMFFSRDGEERYSAQRYNPRFLYTVFDTYARLGKRIQMTELTVPCHSEDKDDEDVQAEIIENLYTVFFSHPAMEGIIYWNLVDGYAAFASPGDMTAGENKFFGGLMRFDMTPKKAFYTIKDLFGKKWHTECEAMTDDNGTHGIRGFYGRYDLEIEIGGIKYLREFSIDSQKNNMKNIIID